MQPAAWQLLAILADGKHHHITELAAQIKFKPQQLNGLWSSMPPHIRGLLRQQDGNWRLVHPLAIWDAAQLQAWGEPHGWQLELLHEHPSSNSHLLEQARIAPDSIHQRMAFVHSQTQGRGRQGKSWDSRLGECLMFSAGWCLDQPQYGLGGLALVSALACCRALERVGVAVQIKWPNDLVVGGEKLGGILIETVSRQGRTAAVIGIGINWVQPKAMAGAGSVQNLVPHASAASFVRNLLPELSSALTTFTQQGLAPFLDDYHRRHRDQNQAVRLLKNGETVLEGTALGVRSDDGALLIRSADGQEQYVVSGEISLRPLHRSLPAVPATERLLLLDAGNSKLKWAWVENGQFVHAGKAPYWDLSALSLSWQQHGHGHVRIVGAAVCGQAKKATVAVALGQTPEWLGSMPQALGIRNHYRHVAEHGADRWFNVLGSRTFTANACVVVSCGTAVTLDALSADNHYLGGNIMPGFNLMKEAMALHTANLNRPIGRPYPFGTTTANALAGGMSDAVCGAVLLMHYRLQQKHPGQSVDILITGGGAAKVKQGLPADFALDNHIQIVDNLVLYGLLNWVSQT